MHRALTKRAPTECALSEYEENTGTKHRAPTNGCGMNEDCVNDTGTKHRAPTTNKT